MNNKKAVKTLLCGMHIEHGAVVVNTNMVDDFLYAICIAVSALMKQEEEKGKNVQHVQEDISLLDKLDKKVEVINKKYQEEN